jgi:hypothetical protein
MSRLVRIPQVTTWSYDPATGRQISPFESAKRPFQGVIVQDSYVQRIMKYVPAEVLGFSVLVNAILEQSPKSGPKAATMAGFPVSSIALAALVLGCLAAPFYVWYIHEKNDAWVVNAVMAFLAFPFWSYALGTTAFAAFRDGNLAAILVVTFTVLSGLVTPRLPMPRAAVKVSDAIPNQSPAEHGVVRLEAVRSSPVVVTVDYDGEDIFVPDGEKVANRVHPAR